MFNNDYRKLNGAGCGLEFAHLPKDLFEDEIRTERLCWLPGSPQLVGYRPVLVVGRVRGESTEDGLSQDLQSAMVKKQYCQLNGATARSARVAGWRAWALRDKYGCFNEWPL